MSELDDFRKREFEAGQKVYDRIDNGEVFDVDAALWNAHLKASTEGEDS